MPISLQLFLRHLACLAFLTLAWPAYPQATLTGAVQFSTNSSGAFSNQQYWNTLCCDRTYDLWFALDSNAATPINGPTDAEAGISIPLVAGTSYKYYTFGQYNGAISYSGLNLFFDGNNSTPGISVYAPLNSTVFIPDHASTVTLEIGSVAGSGVSAFSTDGVVVVLTGFSWNSPAAQPGDVCQAFSFTPGNGSAYFGSFTLQVFPAAALALSQSSSPPSTSLTLKGTDFAANEKVLFFANGAFLDAAISDGTGAFSAQVLEPQHPYGGMQIFALGLTSGKLGVALDFVTPGLVAVPFSVAPGGPVSIEGVGFGSGEAVDVYLNQPRELIGSTTANELGSFVGNDALMVIIPANADPGPNGLIAVGQTTKAIGVGVLTVK